MVSLQPPRHISTLPIATDFALQPNVRFWGCSDRRRSAPETSNMTLCSADKPATSAADLNRSLWIIRLHEIKVALGFGRAEIGDCALVDPMGIGDDAQWRRPTRGRCPGLEDTEHLIAARNHRQARRVPLRFANGYVGSHRRYRACAPQPIKPRTATLAAIVATPTRCRLEVSFGHVAVQTA
jgi:hypothetical protein